MLKSENRPAILHCSAGVGRTGSYVVADIEIEKMLAEDCVDIFKAVSIVRQFRARLVQVSAQYLFIHQVLVDALINKVCFMIIIFYCLTQGQNAVSSLLDPRINNFIDNFIPSTVQPSFDLCVSGRKILFTGLFTVLQDTSKKLAGKVVMVALCNDVLLLTERDAQNKYSLVKKPIPREVVRAALMQSENKTAVSLELANSKLLLESIRSHDGLIFAKLIITGVDFVATEHLAGPSLERDVFLTHDEVVAKLGIFDPNTSAGKNNLKIEYDSIPSVRFHFLFC